jgi:hypothetical protein
MWEESRSLIDFIPLYLGKANASNDNLSAVEHLQFNYNINNSFS